MFFPSSRLGLALVAPALIAAQSLTTYAVTFSNSVHEIVLPTPKVATVTEYMTNPGATTTIIPPASIETYIFTVTGPPQEVTSIANSIPSAARVLGDVSSEAPGAIVPVVIHGFSTSIQIPATASIPTGSVTIAPVNIIAPTPAVVSSAGSEPASVASQANSAASQATIVASNVAGSATNPASIFETAASSVASIATMVTSNIASAATDVASNAASEATSIASTIDGIPTHVPIPIIPLIAASSSLQSASSAAANAVSTATSVAANAISSAFSATATNAISSAAEALSSEVSRTSVATAILSDTTIASATATATTTTGTATGSSSAVQTTLTTTTSSAAATSTPTSSTASSSAPPPSASSTVAPPKSGAARLERAWEGGVGVVAGLVAAVVLV